LLKKLKKDRTERKDPEALALTTDFIEQSMDDLTEFSIYEAEHLNEKRGIVNKKNRKVFCNRPISVKVLMRNPLLTDISIGKIRLHCYYTSDKTDSTEKSSFA